MLKKKNQRTFQLKNLKTDFFAVFEILSVKLSFQEKGQKSEKNIRTLRFKLQCLVKSDIEKKTAFKLDSHNSQTKYYT